jgi:ATP-dependent exoDNAse (exonuclease V) beta subunit
VAFTRAVERLHVITVTSITSRGVTVSDWIGKFVQKNYQETERVYEIGKPAVRINDNGKIAGEALDIPPLKFDTQENAVQIKSSYFREHDAAGDARRQGIVLHELMSSIHHRAEISPAIDNAVTSGVITQNQREIMSGKLQRIVDHPSLSKYYQQGISSRTESELVTSTGEILRPDRVVFFENETVVIDYKTGKENNKKYFAQLDNYAAALASMGYLNIKKLLVYVDEPSVVHVN